jgi:thiamine biosynthesis lipoprotein
MPLFQFGFSAMASLNELQIWADTEAQARRGADAAIADLLRIEAKYSRYRDDSVVATINRQAGNAEVPIDAETAALLRYADQCYRLSGSLFDITSGALRRAWDFRRTPPRLPDEAELRAAVAAIGWCAVEWSGRAIRLPRVGMEIDFGGIGKEYAADRMATICLDRGLAHALVNLGGDVRVAGPQESGEPWRVGIRHPRHAGEVIATVEMTGGALATSGDYERFFEIDDVRYCHLLNARSGWPVRYWQSVSVTAPLCVVAGSCSTIAMLLEDRGEAFLDAQGVRYLAIAGDGSLTGPFAPRPLR